MLDAFGESPQCTPDQFFSGLTAFIDAYEVRRLAHDALVCHRGHDTDHSLSHRTQRAERDIKMKEEKALKVAQAASTCSPSTAPG
jgi:hypothetical protein